MELAHAVEDLLSFFTCVMSRVKGGRKTELNVGALGLRTARRVKVPGSISS